MTEVVIAGAGPNALMLAGELGLAGIRPVVLDPMSGPTWRTRALVRHLSRYFDGRAKATVSSTDMSAVTSRRARR